MHFAITIMILQKLEDTARYAGVFLAPAESFGLRPMLFCPLGKKGVIRLFWPIFGNCWCPVVTLVTFSNNISNFEKNPKKFFKKSNLKKNLKI